MKNKVDIIPKRAYLGEIKFFAIWIIFIFIIDCLDKALLNNIKASLIILLGGLIIRFIGLFFHRQVRITEKDISFIYYPNMGRNRKILINNIYDVRLVHSYIFSHIKITLLNKKLLIYSSMDISSSDLERIVNILKSMTSNNRSS